MSVFSSLAAFLKYAPLVLESVKEVEAAIGAGNGQSKRQLLLAYVLAAIHAGENVPIAQVQAIAGVIDIIVGLLNGLGVFGKTSPSVAVPPSA